MDTVDEVGAFLNAVTVGPDVVMDKAPLRDDAVALVPTFGTIGWMTHG
jgi:hypothetical protein